VPDPSPLDTPVDVGKILFQNMCISEAESIAEEVYQPLYIEVKRLREEVDKLNAAKITIDDSEDYREPDNGYVVIPTMVLNGLVIDDVHFFKNKMEIKFNVNTRSPGISSELFYLNQSGDICPLDLGGYGLFAGCTVKNLSLRRFGGDDTCIMKLDWECK
jgi:hypothetical protein